MRGITNFRLGNNNTINNNINNNLLDRIPIECNKSLSVSGSRRKDHDIGLV